MKSWRMRETIPASAHEALAAFPELLRPFLHARSLTDESAARLFLAPDYDRDLHNPFLLRDMDKAVERIKQAVAASEKIIIFGDYDADGVASAVVLASFFDKIGYPNYEVYIPDRQEEAYGLNSEAITDFARRDVSLIVTVDCGVSNHQEIALAGSLGLDVIVTDHHTVPETLPLAYAVVNPKRPDDNYPYKMLCGAGVAFKLTQALLRSVLKDVPRTDLGIGWEKWLLDLVAIATVADMAPITGENRVLVHFGLKVFRKSPRPGIGALCRVLKLDQSFVTADDIAFLIGPRLNAASRMAHGEQAYRLLSTADSVEAATLADILEGNNRARRTAVGAVLVAAEALVETSIAKNKNNVLVCGNPSWSLGVLGLAASRLAERYQRPVFLWSKNGHGEIKGSCRGDGSINVVSLMRLAGGDDFFGNFGGHSNAGGFSLAANRLGELSERLTAAYQELKTTEVVKEELILDAELSLASVNADVHALLEPLGPFGLDNPKPIFLFRNIPSATARFFGSEQEHLELTLENGEVLCRAIGFFMSSAHGGPVLSSGRPIDLAATMEQSYYRRRPELRLRIVDWRLAE